MLELHPQSPVAPKLKVVTAKEALIPEKILTETRPNTKIGSDKILKFGKKNYPTFQQMSLIKVAEFP